MDATDNPAELYEVPDEIQSSIEGLYRLPFKSEEQAFKSAVFRLVEQNCAIRYAGMPGSRLRARPEQDIYKSRYREALERFFRWTGAPWYPGSQTDAATAAKRLHAAYFAQKIERTYYVPLDRLDLIDPAKQSPSNEIREVRFGPCAVLFLDNMGVNKCFPISALQRFESRYQLRADELTDFFWLSVTEVEDAGPVWKGDGWDILDMPLGGLDSPLYEPVFPGPVEDALFVVLLSLVKEPSDLFWRPFNVPWVYSLSDDPFGRPPRAPDMSKLSTVPFGPLGDEIEVPDRSELT